MQQLFSQTKVSRYASLPPAPPGDENLSSDTIRRSLRREIERIAKLDKHIERHHEAEGFAPSLAIDQVLANSS